MDSTVNTSTNLYQWKPLPYKSIDLHSLNKLTERQYCHSYVLIWPKRFDVNHRFSTHNFQWLASCYYTLKTSLYEVTNCPSLPATVLVLALKVLYPGKLCSSRLFLNLPAATLLRANPFWHHKVYSQNVLKASLIHTVNGFFQKCVIFNKHSS